ncbi:MAG: hypothetical protein AABX82_06690 [Nanoarchaeota archaeon]
MEFPEAFISAMNGARYQRFKGNLEAASAYYDRALIAFPFQYDALFEQADMYSHLDKKGTANILFHAAGEHANTPRQESRALYRVAALSSDETSRCSLLLRAKNKEPSIDEIVKHDYAQLANQANAAGEYEQALRYAQLHTELVSFAPNIYYLQGTLFERFGKQEEAQWSYKLAAAMGHKQAKEKV